MVCYKITNFLTDLSRKIEEKNPVDKKYLISAGNKNGFEDLVTDTITKWNLPSNVKVDFKFGHHFPDIDVFIDNIKYGLELKSRNNGSWTTNGGSVFESVSDADYTDIYILFGSINSKNDTHYSTKFNNYWKCTQEIKVTHKPRYYLNMEADTSIFSTAEEYASLRNMSEVEKNGYIYSKLKEAANKPQWYISENDNVLPTRLESSTYKRYSAELMFLFPQDLLKSSNNENIQANYDRCASFLISSYFVYTTNIRDLFSSGGREKINNISVPKIFTRMRDNSELIKKIISEQSDAFIMQAYDSWSELEIPLTRQDPLEDYKLVLDHLGKQFPNTLNSIGADKLSDIIFDNQ